MFVSSFCIDSLHAGRSGLLVAAIRAVWHFAGDRYRAQAASARGGDSPDIPEAESHARALVAAELLALGHLCPIRPLGGEHRTHLRIVRVVIPGTKGVQQRGCTQGATAGAPLEVQSLEVVAA